MIETPGSREVRRQRRGVSALLGVVGAQGVGHVSAIVWFLLAARSCDVAVFGSFSFVISVVLILQVLIGAGMPQALVRFAPRAETDPRADRFLRRVSILAPCLFGAALLFVLWAAETAGRPLTLLGLDMRTWRLALVCGTAAATITVAGALFQAQGRPALAATVANAVLPLGLALVFLVDRSRLDHFDLMMRFTWVHVAGMALAVPLVLGIASSAGKGVRDEASASLREILAFGRHSLVIGLVYLGLGQVDRLMLGFLDTLEGVGLYSVPSRYARLLLVALYIFPPLVGPVFARHLQGDRQRALDVYRSSARLTAQIVAAVGLALVLAGPELLTVFAGPDYAAAADILYWLVAGVFLIASVGNNGLLLQMGGQEGLEMRLSLLALALNVVLNVLLIPGYGPLGAAVATTISYAATVTIKSVLCRRAFGVLPPVCTDRRLWSGAALLVLGHLGATRGLGLDWRLGLAVGFAAFVVVTRPWVAAGDLAAEWFAARPGAEAER